MRELTISRPAGGRRLEWMDLLRGTAIVLVLAWHAPAVPALFGWPVPEWLTAANDFFLPFRMPSLMFLSGLLLAGSLKKGWREYYVGKFRSLVWPYALWSLIYFTQYEPTHPLTHWRAWYAVGYLWFLFFITVYYFIAPLVTRVFPMWLTPWLFMVASIPLGPSVEKRLLFFGTFFFLGYWLARQPRLLTLVKGWAALAMGAIGVAWGVASAIFGLELAYRGEFALLSISGLLGACWLAAQAKGRWVRPITFIGRHSLVYYVAHFPAMTLVVHAALAAGLAPNPSIWAVNFAVGAAVATGLALFDRKPWASWLFQAPNILTRWILVGKKTRSSEQADQPQRAPTLPEPPREA